MDWVACKDKGFVKVVTKDIYLIASLKLSSKKKINSSKKLPLDEETASSVVSLAYEGLRELLEALALVNEYKIYNHDCFCAFLKECIHKPLLANNFDRFRKIRNQINYYGKDVSVEDAKALRHDIEKMIIEIQKLL